MSATIVVTGTDTNVGKTVFAAGLTRFLDGSYWKPVQAGLDGETDSQAVRRLSELPSSRFLAETWRLTTPASPHWAAEIDRVTIDPDALQLPEIDRPLIVEGAGGLMVPLNRRTLLIDVLQRWNVPVVLCARTGLGTINHTLLSVEAIRRRGIQLLGVAFIGDLHVENERIIKELGEVPILGRLPLLDPLTPNALACTFVAEFRRESFLP